jgi:hypothetical protein
MISRWRAAASAAGTYAGSERVRPLGTGVGSEGFGDTGLSIVPH